MSTTVWTIPGRLSGIICSLFVVTVNCNRELFGNPINPLEFDLDDGPAIEALLKAYPDPITVSDLEHPSDEIDDKIGIAEALFKEGILMIMDVASQPDNVLSQEEDGSDDGGLL